MTWLDRIRSRVFVPGEDLERADRRALLFGATVTAAGLLVPKTIVTIGRTIVPRGLEAWLPERDASMMFFCGTQITINGFDQHGKSNRNSMIITAIDHKRWTISMATPFSEGKRRFQMEFLGAPMDECILR